MTNIIRISASKYFRILEMVLAVAFLCLIFSKRLSAQSYKIDPSGPAFYYKLNKSVIEAVHQQANFKPGDYVADIGAGTGLFDVSLSLYSDSLNFYLEDIDTSSYDRENFERGIQYFSAMRGRPLTDSYLFSIGSDQSTGLPDSLFDAVLVIDTYHHFSHRDAMVEDIYRILKKGGKLLLYDALAKRQNDIHPICHTRIYLKEDLISQIRSHRFTFDGMTKLKRMVRRKTGLFVFTK